MTLVEFLLARITEDEAVARAASVMQASWEQFADAYLPSFGEMPVHARRWTPARVLAECEAKRRIIELHGPDADWDQNHCAVCLSDRKGWEELYVPDELPCKTLRLLALPYVGHLDYREEWRP